MGYGLDVAVSHYYGANMAYFYITMLTYNLMNWLKEGVLGQRQLKRMAQWVRQHFLLIAGRLVSKGRRLILRLSRGYPWKEEYQRAEACLETLKLPLPT